MAVLWIDSTVLNRRELENNIYLKKIINKDYYSSLLVAQLNMSDVNFGKQCFGCYYRRIETKALKFLIELNILF
jgi:hypothetical protein